jgi:glycosyltransferase involved in cell wall biosynthesis
MESQGISSKEPVTTSHFQHSGTHMMNGETAHISVCVCTYRRPQYLRRLLEKVVVQVTDGQFTYSIVVVDNDQLRSAEALVSDFAASSSIPIRYFVEPEQNIARARNKAVGNATGDYVAFIDDDEFPVENWLLTLFEACRRYDVAGVLGPVNPHFDEEPPRWIRLGKFWQRPTYPTGTIIDGMKGRTGNVLFKKEIIEANEGPFRPEFQTGEDQDFFSRMIERGHIFVWCNEAIAYEIVPPARWERSFILKRSFFQGSFSPLNRRFGVVGLAKSFIAIPIYVVALPLAAIAGHHRFMKILTKLAYHAGAVVVCLGIKAAKITYSIN